MTIVVEDNGRGFKVDETLRNDQAIGLKTLQDRIEMLGGDFNVQSGLGHGTRVEFAIPLETELEVI